MRRMMFEIDDGDVLAYGSERLRSQKQLALLALSQIKTYAPRVLASLTPALQDDAGIVIVAASEDHRSLEHASGLFSAAARTIASSLRSSAERSCSESPCSLIA